MSTRIDKDTLLQPGTIEAVLKDIDSLVNGIKNRLGQVKTEFKGIYDQFGKPIPITGENVSKINQAAVSVQKLATEQKKLTEQERQLQKIQNTLTREVARSSPEYIKAAAAAKSMAQANRQAVVDQQKMMGTFKPGAVSNFINSIKGLAVAYLGLSTAIRVAKDIFTTTKELDVLSQSFKYLITDTNELSQTQGFLTDITKRYGLELVSTSQSYLKFRASIAGSNFDLEESRKLFESVAKAGSVLGLNAQRMELVFLALEQMISKGTISMEELRRQLGDNLPGAMRIMADALGVTIPELMKMIKANQVLAEDALPKFRVQLEKAYGIESVKTIDNLQASVNALKNSWTQLIKAISASDTIKGFLKSLTNEFEMLQFALNPEKFIQTFGEGQGLSMFKTYIDSAKKLNDEAKIRESILNKIKSSQNEIKQISLDIEGIEQKTKLSTKELEKLRTSKVQQEAYKTLITELQILLASQDDYNKAFKATAEEGFIPDDEMSKLQDELDMADGLIGRLEAQKKIYEYLRVNVPKGKEEIISGYNLEIKKIEEQISVLNSLGVAQQELADKLTKMFSEDIADAQKEFDDTLEQSIKDSEDLAEQQVEISEKLSDARIKNFIDEYDREKSDREQFGREMGILNDQEYKKELEYLKYFLETKEITEEEYFVLRSQLWMKYNSDLIDSVSAFTNSMFDLLSELTQGQIDEAQRQVDAQEEKLDNLKAQLDEEKELKDQGKANDYDRLVSQIADTQRLRDEANKDLEKAQKRQAAIQLAAQASDIITATANIIEGWTSINPVAGVLMGLAQVAAMISAFAAYKNQIKSISKYAEGGEIIGKKHSEGGEIIEAEDGEFVTKARSTQRSKKLLTAINDGEITDFDLYKLNFTHDLSKSNYQRYDSTSEMLAELKASKEINQKMLSVLEEVPVATQLRDGRIMLKTKYKTQIITLG